MKTTFLGALLVTGVCAVIVTGIMLPAPWLARESLFEFAAREPRNKDAGEPGAPPQDDPVKPVGDPEAPGEAAAVR